MDDRALENLTQEIRDMNQALHEYTNRVTQYAIQAGHAEAAGRAAVPFGSVGSGKEAAFVQASTLEGIKVKKEENDLTQKKNAVLKQEWQALVDIQKKLQDLDGAWDRQKRMLVESTGLQEKEIELRRKEFEEESRQLERRGLISSRDEELVKKGMAPVGDQDSPKGILMQIKEHFVKGDAFSKSAMVGLAASGGIAAISFAIDAIKGFGSDLKKTVGDMPKDMRAALTSGYAGVSAGSMGGAGGLFSQQMVGLQQNVSTNKFFQAANVTGDQFLEALMMQSRMLGTNAMETDKASKEIADMAVRAHVAGVSLKEYQQTVIDLTHTAGIGIANEARARELADQIYETEKKEHLERGFLLNNIKSTYNSLATMGYTIENVTGINVRFAEEIKKGTMSLQDIVAYAKGMKEANQGQHVFALQQIQTLGSPEQQRMASRIAKEGGGDPLMIATLMRGLAENNADVMKKFGMSGTQGSEWYKSTINDVMYKFAERNLGVSGGKESMDYLRFAETLSKTFGLAMPTETLEKTQEYLRESSVTGPKLVEVGQKTLDTAAAQLAGMTTIGEWGSRIYNVLLYSVADSLTGINRSMVEDINKSATRGDFSALTREYAAIPENARSSTMVQDMLRGAIGSGNFMKTAESAGIKFEINDARDPEAVVRRIMQELEKITQQRGREEKSVIDASNRGTRSGRGLGATKQR